MSVSEWTRGAPVCRIVCTRGGHRKRSIDRVRWESSESWGELYSAGRWRRDAAGDLPDQKSSAERMPVVDPAHFRRDTKGRPVVDPVKWRLRCPTCGLDVVLSMQNLDRLGRWVHESAARQIELERLAAIVAS